MDPHVYVTASVLLPRLLGLIYIFVFGAFIFQMKGLFGAEGIRPIGQFLEFIKYRLGKWRFHHIPTLFWINSSDRALLTLVITGTIFSILLMFGILPPIMLFLLFILHLSIVSAGQDFLSFGWESFLLEIVCNAFFLSLTSPPNPLIWISLSLLLFRFHFQAGVSKLKSRDLNWRNLSAIWYHYQSQPLPNTQAWYFHKLPLSIHKVSTALMFFAELVVPFFVFGRDDLRFVAFLFLFGLQFFIWFTGNLSYLNHLTSVFCVILVSDHWFKMLLDWTITPPPPSLIYVDVFVSAVGACLIFMQLISLWNYFMPPNPTFYRILNWVQPYHIINRYGIFAIMTTKRYEIIIEGSDDEVKWKEYLFRYKPSELTRRPGRISPYQPRIDWQAWFLPFSNYHEESWFQDFLVRLLQGSPHVLKLLRYNPFPEKPPKYIRALIYDYEFTSVKEKKETGAWWRRTYAGIYSPVLYLKPINNS